MNELMNENQMPFDTDELYQIHRKIISEIESILEKSTRDFLDGGQIFDLKRDFKEKMEKEFEAREKLNEEKSKIVSTNLIYGFFNSFKLPPIDSMDSFKTTMIKEKQIEFNNFLTIYLQKAKGPYKGIFNKIFVNNFCKIFWNFKFF